MSVEENKDNPQYLSILVLDQLLLLMVQEKGEVVQSIPIVILKYRVNRKPHRYSFHTKNNLGDPENKTTENESE